jgi:putative ABC transport system ATP-binding protein
MHESMLALNGITKIFNAGTVDEKHAIDNLELEIKKGEFITVIGSNGSGKSTLMNIIAGTLKPDAGVILVDGENVTSYPDFKMANLIARVFQSTTMGTAPDMTIEENLCMAELRGKRRGLKWGVTNKRRDHYREILKVLDLGLEYRLKQRVGLLSGGQRQSMTLLMTTLTLPKLLLLDEHTAALDPKTAAKVMELTEKVVYKNNLTTLMVTHNMRHALKYGDRMVMLHEGHIQFDVKGDEKKSLTIEELVHKFGKSLADDTLLTVK